MCCPLYIYYYTWVDTIWQQKIEMMPFIKQVTINNVDYRERILPRATFLAKQFLSICNSVAQRDLSKRYMHTFADWGASRASKQLFHRVKRKYRERCLNVSKIAQVTNERYFVARVSGAGGKAKRAWNGYFSSLTRKASSFTSATECPLIIHGRMVDLIAHRSLYRRTATPALAIKLEAIKNSSIK